MSNNNEAPEPNDNNNEQIDHNNPANNIPEWGAFPDLLRVQELLQNGGGAPEPNVGLQRAGVSNPPDVSLPGAAGRDPPPPDFDIDTANRSALQNQRLPDMALDANQAQAAGDHHPDDRIAGRCGGARVRPRRGSNRDSPGLLDQLGRAAVAENRNDNFERSECCQRLLNEVQEMRQEISMIAENYRTLDGRFRRVERLLQQVVSNPQRARAVDDRQERHDENQRREREITHLSRTFADSLRVAMVHFMRQISDDGHHSPPEGD